MKDNDKGLIDRLTTAASMQRMALPVPPELFEEAAKRLADLLEEQTLVLDNVIAFRNEMATSLQILTNGLTVISAEKDQLRADKTELQRQLDMLHGRRFSERDYTALHSQVKQLEAENDKLRGMKTEPDAGTRYISGYCKEGDRCVCGGDTPGVRATCGNWRSV